MSITTRSTCSSLSHGGDASERDHETELDEGYMSDRNFVFAQDTTSAEYGTDSEPESEDERQQGRREHKEHQHRHQDQDQHRHQQDEHTGKHSYTSACASLGIPPSSHVLSRLSSDRLSVRHALLNPASATALSAGLSANRCIRSLNLGSNLLGDDNARPLLEAVSGNPSLTKLDLSRNLLSDRFGALLARNISSPLCALEGLVLAENFLSDAFSEALSKGFLGLVVVKSRIPLRTLDVSNNKISNRDKEALASILRSCSCLASLNLSWNDLRDVRRSKQQKGRRGKDCCFPFASAALSCPGRLVSLELSFNGLTDDFGVAIGTMLGENASLLVLDLSRNHLKKSAALSIADGLESNRSLTTLKLGWNNLGREGTLRVIKAIGGNQGSLQIVRLENTTDAGMESEAAREAGVAVASRPQWVEVVCEFPDRARTRGSPHGGPVSWMNEQAPELDANTTYKTRIEKDREMEIEKLTVVVEALKARASALNNGNASRITASGRSTAVVARSSGARLVTTPSRETGKISGTARDGSEGKQGRPSSPGPVKEAATVPVLSVRLKLIAREEARLQGERMAAEEALAAAVNAKKQQSGMLSYLKPLNKAVKEKTLAEPPPRALMLAKARAGTYHTAVLRARAERKRSPRRGRSMARSATVRVASGGKARRQAHGHNTTTSNSRSQSAWGPVQGGSGHGARGRGFKSSSTDARARLKSPRQSGCQGRAEGKRKVACSRNQLQLDHRGRSRTTRKSRRASPSGRPEHAFVNRGDHGKIN